MKRRLIIVAVAAVMALLFAQVAFAWGGPRGQWGVDGDTGTPVNFAQELNLTQEQEQQIQSLMEEKFQENQQYRDKFRNLRQEMRSMQWQSDVSQEQLEAKVKEMQQVRDQMYEQRQACRSEMLEILNDDQVQQMTQQCPRGAGGKMGRGGFGGPGAGGQNQ